MTQLTLRDKLEEKRKVENARRKRRREGHAGEEDRRFDPATSMLIRNR